MSTDLEITLKLQEDNTQAFDIIYWKYHKAIYRNILRITKDEIVAADILQEVFCILWEKRHHINAEQGISNWLFVISFNQSINFQRQKLRESTAYYNAECVDNEQEVENADLYQTQYGLIRAAVDQLSPQKQKVFTLCKLDGKSYEEAANILNISKHTVKEYLSNAMAFVKDFVKKHSTNWNATGL